MNGLPAPCLCALPGKSETPIVGRDLCTRSRSCDH
ncbi:unnamed protein product [Staurois parvus]|uniref:Uncharacterized protein n=1 Tax=Staurois parvus TaxID=386267 RepID=A0ABN9G6L7_9NEOB|nr:unnamed protein product [Staurois parvus]